MNQDQVKELLLTLEPDTEEFFVIFTGKSSKKVNGLYKPDSREILIHNKNFRSDNDLIYTAIHEFAHHLHFTRSAVPITRRAQHSHDYWVLFHSLLEKAEGQQVYRSVFEDIEEFRALIQRIKVDYLARDGFIMKELGKVLKDAEALCKKHDARFEDFVDRVLGIHRNSARMLIRLHEVNVNPSIGYENMKTVVGIKSDAQRQAAENAFLGGRSPDLVKAEFKKPQKQEDPVTRIRQEISRVQKTIDSLQNRLEDLQNRLTGLGDGA